MEKEEKEKARTDKKENRSQPILHDDLLKNIMETNRLAMAKVKRPQPKQVEVEVEKMDDSPQQPVVLETNVETPKQPVTPPVEEEVAK